MEKMTLYCEAKFLSDFFDYRPKENTESLFFEAEVENWRSYRQLFFENNILLDISTEEFKSKQDNAFWKMLGKLKTDGKLKVKFDNFPINYNEVNQHSIFFMSNSGDCEKLENEHGMLFISNHNLYQRAKFLFSHDNFRTINNKIDWNTLDDFKHPCNFMLFIDNFIFEGKEKDIVEKNLMMLLDTLLPIPINDKFEIKIMTKDPNKRILAEKEDRRNDWKCKSKDELEDFVKDIVKSIRKEIKVKIKYVDYSEHDRHLITNYCWLSSGYGFILNENERAKGTDVHIHRIISPNVKARVIELIDRLKK